MLLDTTHLLRHRQAAFAVSFALATLLGTTAAGAQQGPTRSTHALEPARQINRPPPDQIAPRGPDTLGRVRYWNEVALDASAMDHIPPVPGENRIHGEQYGPGRTARALAIVQIAVFDAVNSIDRRYESYSDPPPAPEDASIDAAIAPRHAD